MSQVSLTDNQYILGGFEHALVIIIVGFVAYAIFKNTQLFTTLQKKLLTGLLLLLAIVYIGQYILAVVSYTDNIRPFYAKERYSQTGL